MTSASLPPGLARAVERHLLACPLCGAPLEGGSRSLACAGGHSFDVARQGHVHLAPGRRPPANYDRALMLQRAAVIAAGYFDALFDLAAPLLEGVEPDAGVLDAGCGEGSLLTRLNARRPFVGVGIDLAPEGVRLAAARSKEQAWCVADLAAIPSPDRAFAAVLNILSPANYREFARVLAPGGLIVKAWPTARHLAELRAALGLGDDYSNEPVAELFRAFAPTAQVKRVESAFPCGSANAAALIGMTPLGWHATAEQRDAFLANPPPTVTVSLDVAWARIA